MTHHITTDHLVEAASKAVTEKVLSLAKIAKGIRIAI